MPDWVMEIGGQLDLAMATAWPPAVTQDCDGWTLRYAEGITRRANSVLACGRPAELGAAVAEAEQFYAQRDAAPVFLVSEASTPPEVTDELTSRGYVEDAPTWIIHRELHPSPRSVSSGTRWTIDVSDSLTDTWFDSYWAVEGDRRGPAAAKTLRHVLLRPTSPTRFVTVSEQGSVLSVGQVVVVGEWACLQCLATVAAGRRRGAGTAVIEALTEQAASLGAKGTFGAVMADNDASLGLFDRLGYERSHKYRYLVRTRVS